jgi:hypothetical protein
MNRGRSSQTTERVILDKGGCRKAGLQAWLAACAWYRGVTRMRNLAKTCLAVTACLAVAGVASAANEPAMMPMDASVPFVSVSFQGEPANLGTLWGPGPRSVLVPLHARVVANCPYHVAASFRTFRHEQGKAVVSPKDLMVAINGQEIPVGNGRVSVAQSSKPTSLGGVEVPLNLLVKVKGLDRYHQGPYRGALVITVMAGP